MLHGERVRALRLEKKYTHQELADELEVNIRQIARFESGGTDTSGESLVKLAQVFSVSTDYLLGLTDDPTPRYGIADLTPTEQAVLDALRRNDPLAAVKAILCDT